jgi:hypothetical protein
MSREALEALKNDPAAELMFFAARRDENGEEE